MKKIVNGKVIEFTEEEITVMRETEEEYKNTPQYISIRIEELKQMLSDTDYIACKIVEGAATIEEYSDIIKQKQQWRDEINELESILKAKEEEELEALENGAHSGN